MARLLQHRPWTQVPAHCPRPQPPGGQLRYHIRHGCALSGWAHSYSKVLSVACVVLGAGSSSYVAVDYDIGLHCVLRSGLPLRDIRCCTSSNVAVDLALAHIVCSAFWAGCNVHPETTCGDNRASLQASKSGALQHGRTFSTTWCCCHRAGEQTMAW